MFSYYNTLIPSRFKIPVRSKEITCVMTLVFILDNIVISSVWNMQSNDLVVLSHLVYTVTACNLVI